MRISKKQGDNILRLTPEQINRIDKKVEAKSNQLRHLHPDMPEDDIQQLASKIIMSQGY
jgi:hypothetical protein